MANDNQPDKVIYSMHRVTKRHGQREVLKDISLGYFYGATCPELSGFSERTRAVPGRQRREHAGACEPEAGALLPGGW